MRRDNQTVKPESLVVKKLALVWMMREHRELLEPGFKCLWCRLLDAFCLLMWAREEPLKDSTRRRNNCMDHWKHHMAELWPQLYRTETSWPWTYPSIFLTLFSRRKKWFNNILTTYFTEGGEGIRRGVENLLSSVQEWIHCYNSKLQVALE